MQDVQKNSEPDIGTFTRQSALPVVVIDRSLNIVFANAAYASVVHRPDENLVGCNILDVYVMSPEVKEQLREKCGEAFSGNVSRTNVQPYHEADADGVLRLRYWQATQEPVRNEAGEVEYVVQRIQDVSYLVNLQQKNDLVAAELDHRVKNLFSVILATARISSTNATSVKQYTDDFCGRLESMARYHNKMSEQGWTGLALREIFEEELKYGAPGMSDRYSISGVDAVLSQRSTKDGGMIIHELVSNATKSGCFTQPDGRLDISWTISDGTLRIVWDETGMKGVKPPERKGFGLRFLSMMPNATVRLEFRDIGLRIEYDVPVHLSLDGFDFQTE